MRRPPVIAGGRYPPAFAPLKGRLAWRQSRIHYSLFGHSPELKPVIPFGVWIRERCWTGFVSRTIDMQDVPFPTKNALVHNAFTHRVGVNPVNQQSVFLLAH